MVKLNRCTLLVILTALSGCGASDDGASDRRGPKVFVSIAPLAYFAERIADDRLEIGVLIAPGRDPHTYAPTPKQMTRLARSDLLLCTGTGFEQVISERLAGGATRLKIVNLAEGVDLLPEGGHGHASGEPDRHVWMSPKVAGVLAGKICDELCTLDPDGAGDYRENLRKLQANLDGLDAKLTAALAPLKDKAFFVFHPAFGYFARDYHLKQVAVETGGKSPGPRHLTELIARARADGVKVIFVQPQFSERAAGVIAEQIGGVVVPLDPLAKDYISNLERIGDEIRKALTPRKE